MTSKATTYKATYKKVNDLKADTVKILQEATGDWTSYSGIPAAITLGYADRFNAIENKTTTETAEEFPQLLESIMSLGKGRFSMLWHGSQLWVANGFYGKDGEKQYKWETRNNRHGLKALGLRWSPKHQEWYYKRDTSMAAAVNAGDTDSPAAVAYKENVRRLSDAMASLDEQGVTIEVHGLQTSSPVAWAMADKDSAHTAELKAAGFRWSEKKQAWWVKMPV